MAVSGSVEATLAQVQREAIRRYDRLPQRTEAIICGVLEAFPLARVMARYGATGDGEEQDEVVLVDARLVIPCAGGNVRCEVTADHDRSATGRHPVTYLLFAGHTIAAAGGALDFVGVFNTREQAEAALPATAPWAQIARFDGYELRIVREHQYVVPTELEQPRTQVRGWRKGLE